MQLTRSILQCSARTKHFTFLLLIPVLLSCNWDSSEKVSSEEIRTNQKDLSTETIQNLKIVNEEGSTFPDQGNLVEVTTNAMDFQVSEQILSGWTTFRYYNNSTMTHFFQFEQITSC